MEVLGPLLDVVFPARCVGCGVVAAGLCPACLARARPAPAGPGGAAPPPGLDWWVAAFSYEGAVREALARVKYRNARSALPGLAAGLVEVVRAATPGPVDVVTWPPTTAARRRRRGFDQAEHLARAVGGGLGVPVRRCLERRAGAAQTGRSAGERRRGPVFTVRPGASLGRVLVVDDVATTGATLVAAAASLRAAGAETVGGATVARTPRRARSPPGADRSSAAQGDLLGRRYHR